LKYSRKDLRPVISITYETATDNGRAYHLLRINDNGIGFDNNYSEKIFHMFARLHGNKEYGGSGVGLSIVKKVVENHGGIVRAEGKEGEGAVFEVWLPE
ncbi:MAG: ATP-binding protein, partial [Sphingobacteriales bacterium]